MWHDMERRAPDVMRKSIIVVDCLADDSEAVIEKVTGVDWRSQANPFLNAIWQPSRLYNYYD